MGAKKTNGINGIFMGLAMYAVCTGIAALPIFPHGLDFTGVVQLGAAAIAATLLVAAVRYSRIQRYLHDQGAMMTQAVLGIAVSGGLYSALSTAPRPEVMFMAFLLWTAMSLMHLTPYRVVVLFALNVGLFLNAFSADLLLGQDANLKAEVGFMLLASTVMMGFMYLRAVAYTRVRREKSRLQEENIKQATRLREAEERIHAVTVQDMDTIALKYPYFKKALLGEKLRADKDGTTFSIGLVEIDHFAEIKARCGELVAKQLLRAFADRATALVRKMDFVTADERYHPLGRVGDGLFGLILPGANLKGAKYCTQRLISAVEFRDIPTEIGPITITVTIGVTEYTHGDDVEAMLAQLARSLEKARYQHEQELVAKRQAREPQSPLKGARSLQEMELLDHKDYGRPVH